jgi:Bacterial SH3 domain
VYPRIVLLVALGAALLSACDRSPPVRPLDGAPVVRTGQTASGSGGFAPPPTRALPATLAPVVAGGGTPPASGPAPPSAPSPTPLGTPGFVIVATDGRGANLRTRPSLSAPIVTTVRAGAAVEVLGDPVEAEGRSWRQIRTGDRDGWVVAVVVRER